MARIGYVVSTNSGEVRLFNSKKAAESWEASKKDRYISAGAEVDIDAHYRGKIPASGVRFYREDMSTAQLIGEMANA